MQEKGRRLKMKKRGKTKLLLNVSESDIFASQFEDTVSGKCPKNCNIMDYSEKQKTQFVCGICEEILPYKSVSAKCDALCSQYLSGIFTSCTDNEILCPVCTKKITFCIL